MPGSLYVVSTPIGNLDDITLRALSTLKSVSLIAAEDTRRTSILLRHFGITTPATSLHAHNERQKLPFILQKLAKGEDVALVSDAGTPLVADPGQRLIAAAIEHGIRVIAIPGASAVLAALAVSGYPGDTFLFAGFAPSKSNDRKRWLQSLAAEVERPIIFFETPHRIQKTLLELQPIFGERPIIVARELTKLHEEVIRSTTSAIRSAPVTARGEFTLILGPGSSSKEQPQIIEDKDIAEFFYQLTNNAAFGRRAALTATAHNFGLSTKYVYAALERFKASSTS
ncbi:MAG: 16S rRNA (cytidine(1402)-2'-O)-methyltransferase [Vicinamibacterales bacterium]|nr:16S rRNA (cytidine(1402)-2'-O)-methyltransferase [Vicinamibacterales bacterium]